MRNQNRVGTIGLPPGNQTTNCAYSDRLPFAQTYLCIAVCVYLHTHFVQTRTQDVSIKCTCNYEWPIDYQWYVNIKKCNGVIQNLGTDVSEKQFRTKSVSVLHHILPVYFNIISPGLGPSSNFEKVIIIFELENIGWVTTKRCCCIEETYFSAMNWEIYVCLYRKSKNRILPKRIKALKALEAWAS